MNHVLQTIFLEDVINNIDQKYKELITYSQDKFYTYANIFKMPLYYKLFTFKPNPDYGLYNKLLNQNNYDVINICIKKIQENNYNQSMILTLYSYVCNLVFEYYTIDYILHFSKCNKRITNKRKTNKYSKTAKIIEAQFYEERYHTNINKFKINPTNLEIAIECFDLLDEIFCNVFLMSYGIDVFIESYTNFVSYQKKLYNNNHFIEKIITKIFDTFTRTKKYSATSIYNLTYIPNDDFLNKENNIWIKKNNETTQSFYDIYDEAIIFATKIINLISENIYYQIKNNGLILNELNKLKK